MPKAACHRAARSAVATGLVELHGGTRRRADGLVGRIEKTYQGTGRAADIELSDGRLAYYAMRTRGKGRGRYGWTVCSMRTTPGDWLRIGVASAAAVGVLYYMVKR